MYAYMYTSTCKRLKGFAFLEILTTAKPDFIVSVESIRKMFKCNAHIFTVYTRMLLMIKSRSLSHDYDPCTN